MDRMAQVLIWMAVMFCGFVFIEFVRSLVRAAYQETATFDAACRLMLVAAVMWGFWDD